MFFLFHADGQTDTDMTILIVTFRNRFGKSVCEVRKERNKNNYRIMSV